MGLLDFSANMGMYDPAIAQQMLEKKQEDERKCEEAERKSGSHWAIRSTARMQSKHSKTLCRMQSGRSMNSWAPFRRRAKYQ